ncbi:MAG TPA: dihydrodipicolinate reductase C-terminal domain-containing protein [Bdellovibrionota bacterium]|jgi:4-hydroxy-tetrahydrodipicolinate reductase|nr:dihydrodipicolinate reductase C-terminal domain-containing protein [Bdellovibrionota bacterium]
MRNVIGVLGTGKTGGEVLNRLRASGKLDIVTFDSQNPPNAETWQRLDAAICFLPGPAFLSYFDLLIAHPVPMVIGSTGYELSKEQSKRIEALPCPWVMSSNFSLGMALAKSVITLMSSWAAQSGLPLESSISETHHVHKKDAPSGTALLWKRWATEAAGTNAPKIDIESHRVEDHCGLHEYRLALPQETMTFKHDAASRGVFAEGAVWALEKILAGAARPGRNDFFDLIQRSLKEGTP